MQSQMEKLQPQRGLLTQIYDFFITMVVQSASTETTSIPTSPATLPASSNWIEDVALSSVDLLIVMNKNTSVSNGVAISPHLILTALHGKVALHQQIIVTDRKGIKRDGIVDFISFTRELKDITVIRVGAAMSKYIPLAAEKVTLGAEVCVVGYKCNAHGDASLFLDTSTVNCIESEPSSMYLVGRTAYEELSGAGAFVGRGAHGEAVVVGVHVTRQHPFTFICDPNRVEEFLAYLREQATAHTS